MAITQENCRILPVTGLLVVALLFSGNPGFSQTPAPTARPDPILMGTAGPCDPGTAQADLVANTDVNGHPVTPADLAAGPIPLTGQIDLPLPARRGQRPAYVTVDGAKLGGLLNPEPGCAAPAH